jgi:hypothetical protein
MPKETNSLPDAPPAETPDVLPRPDFHFEGQIGRTYLDSDPAQFPQPVTAPKGAPNILLILIDDCGFGEFGAFGGGIPSPMGRPSLIGHRKSMTYYPGTIGLPDAASPPMCNKSWTITADIELPDGKAEGMVVTHGGLEGDYGLYLRDGKPTFVYNFHGADRPTFAAKEPLPKGKVTLVVDFKYDGGGMGKGGQITMSANGKTIAEGRLEKTIPIQFSLGEGLDVGMDIGSPVDFTYKLPFAFTGQIEKVKIELGAVEKAGPA